MQIQDNNTSIFDLQSLGVSEIVSKKQNSHKKNLSINNLAIKFITEPTDANFERLMLRVKWGLKKFIYKILNDNDASTDIMSRTMETVYIKRDTFNIDRGNFSTWMYKIAFNYCIKYMRGDFKYDMPDTIMCDFIDAYDSSVDDESFTVKETDDAVMNEIADIIFKNGLFTKYTKEDVTNGIYDASVKYMDNLPDNLKIVMRERYLNHKKVEQISIDNNIPLTSVKNWLRKGATVLNDELKKSVPEMYSLYLEIKNNK